MTNTAQLRPPRTFTALRATPSNTGWASVDEVPMSRRISAVAFSRLRLSVRRVRKRRFLATGSRPPAFAFAGFARRRIVLSLPLGSAGTPARLGEDAIVGK